MLIEREEGSVRMTEKSSRGYHSNYRSTIGNIIVTVHRVGKFSMDYTFFALDLRTLFPLTAFKNARNPKFVRNLSQRLFLGVPVRGTEIWKNLSKFVRKLPFFKFWQIFPNFSPPDWNPQKQSLGQISDKFGFSGVFEGCKGEKGSQAEGTKIFAIQIKWLIEVNLVDITKDGS